MDADLNFPVLVCPTRTCPFTSVSAWATLIRPAAISQLGIRLDVPIAGKRDQFE
jgi:hypothetical protein